MILRLLRAAPLLATITAAVWALSANPLAAPMVERNLSDLALKLEREVRRTATAEWIAAELRAAVQAEDADRAAMLIALAEDLERDVDTAPARALIERSAGWLATASDCAACMADAQSCPSLAQIGACAVPFELSPLGDVNALRRAATAWATGEEIDQLDAGLAIVGLTATGAILFTGGASVPVKAGTSLLRLARRMGSVTPALARELTLPIRWGAVPGWLRGAAPLGEVTDAARVARVSAIAADLGRVRDATSTSEALRLARLIDTPEDAARLARVAEAAGPRTTRTFAVLGKGRAFRATVRLSRAAAATLALIWLLLAQLAAILGSWIGGTAFRAATTETRRPIEPPLRRTPTAEGARKLR